MCGTFEIKKFYKKHTCGRGIATMDHLRASKMLVADIVESKLKSRPLYRACDLKKNITNEYGIGISYHKAW